MKYAIALAIFSTACGNCLAEEFPIYLNKDGSTSDRYCGLYCVYQAGNLTGHPVALDSLIRPHRLLGKYGSTAADLSECCEECNIPHRYISAASYLDVFLLDRPAIVLIKNSPDAPEANHWVMLLESFRGTAKVYDPSCGVLFVSAAELQSLWGGHVLLIENDHSRWNHFLWHFVKIIFCLFFGGSVFAGMRIGLRFKWNSYCVLIAVPVILATVTQAIDPSSFLYNLPVVKQIAAIRSEHSVKLLKPSELLSERDDFIVVDVRTPRQYHASSILDSVNIPLQSPYWKNRQALSKYTDDQKIVFYCNSVQCKWAEIMSKSPLCHRFTNMYVLEGGLSDYVDAHGTLIGETP